MTWWWWYCWCCVDCNCYVSFERVDTILSESWLLVLPGRLLQRPRAMTIPSWCLLLSRATISVDFVLVQEEENNETSDVIIVRLFSFFGKAFTTERPNHSIFIHSFIQSSSQSLNTLNPCNKEKDDEGYCVVCWIADYGNGPGLCSSYIIHPQQARTIQPILPCLVIVIIIFILID